MGWSVVVFTPRRTAGHVPRLFAKNHTFPPDTMPYQMKQVQGEITHVVKKKGSSDEQEHTSNKNRGRVLISLGGAKSTTANEDNARIQKIATLKQILYNAFNDESVVDIGKLCVKPKEAWWQLDCELVIVEDDGIVFLRLAVGFSSLRTLVS